MYNNYMSLNKKEKRQLERQIDQQFKNVTKNKGTKQQKIMGLIVLVAMFALYQYEFGFLKPARVQEGMQLVKCVDGDTAKLDIEGVEKTVRFLAVDTPELKSKDFYAREAADYTCSRLSEAQKIHLEYDDESKEEDKYGRKLAWVYVDGELLQKELIAKGYAKVKYIYGDYKYLNELEQLEIQAKAKKIGVWKN